ncbi:MAG: 50S ribosomal protein L10 [bacterium]
MKREEKVAVIKELGEKFGASSAIWLTDYNGLNALNITKLRRKLHDKNLDYKVIKNTILEYVFKDIGVETPQEWLKGMVGVCYGKDATTGAKLLIESQGLKLKGAYIEGNFYGIDKIKEIARIPSREVLLAKLCGTLKSPISNCINVLNAPIRDVVYTINAVSNKKKGE